MADNTQTKQSLKSKLGGLMGNFRKYWNTPEEGRYVPYKEYLSIFAAVGGNYSASYIMGFLSFGTGCYLVAFYYEIPILTFTAINTFFIAAGYFWSILNMGVDANLGFLPKKVERRYNTVYLVFTVLGLAFMIFDMSKILPWPDFIREYADMKWPGLNLMSICKIFGVHWVVCGWGGFRAIFIRKKLVPKLGRYKIFAYSNVIQCVILALLICELPLYKEPLIDRVWKLYTLFAFYGMLNFTGSPQAIADNISPNAHERMLVRSWPVKLSHIVRSILTILLPTIAGWLFRDGIRDIGTFKYLLPVCLILCTILMFSGLNKIHERIPAPPVEKKKYYSFWTCIRGIFRNKYLWIRQVSFLLDSLGNGMLAIKTIMLVYVWRETGLYFALAENVIAFVGNPGAFLAPWIRKRFQYKTLYVFKQLVSFCASGVYALAIFFLGKTNWLCGLAMFLAMCVCDALNSAIEIASSDMDIRVNDYQMYLSGERFEAYQGVIGWFTTPISTLVSLIIPLMFYRFGFTSDWDILFIESVRMKCVITGLAFDMAGYLLMTLPYIFFWDYTDEKHTKVMEELKKREEAAARGETVLNAFGEVIFEGDPPAASAAETEPPAS